MAATVLASDGLPRFVWTDAEVPPSQYASTLLRLVAERRRWRVEYEQAVGNNSASRQPLPP
jgi:hypothetical protein